MEPPMIYNKKELQCSYEKGFYNFSTTSLGFEISKERD